jgi:hypothetical protein
MIGQELAYFYIALVVLNSTSTDSLGASARLLAFRLCTSSTSGNPGSHVMYVYTDMYGYLMIMLLTRVLVHVCTRRALKLVYIGCI